MPAHRRFFTGFLFIVFVLVIAGKLGLSLNWQPAGGARGPDAGAMLIAPVIDGVDACIAPNDGDPPGDPPSPCTGPTGSAAALVAATLKRLQPVELPEGAGFPLGYTLEVPLLRLFRRDGAGWAIDDERVRRVVRTIEQSPRALILGLRSAPFAGAAPLAAELAADVQNLAHTRDGPLRPARVQGEPFYPWTLARSDNAITARRVQAAQALLAALCTMAPEQRARIRGITLLGELHQLVPDLETGWGFDGPYRVSDHGPASVAGFRHFLRQRFGAVAKLNALLGTDYATFDEVQPPARDMRVEPGARLVEHIDSYAQGSFAVAGWATLAGAETLFVQVYLDGEFMGRVPVDRARFDAPEGDAPPVGSRAGWRIDVDYRKLAPGKKRVDVLLELAPGELVQLGSRTVEVVAGGAVAAPARPPHEPPTLPARMAAPDALRARVEMPREGQSYYYNPLVPPWHAWRRQQVRDYLHFFDGVVARSCLGAVPRYSHQPLPEANPAWDANKFAVDDTLRTEGDLHLGLNLYGSASDDAEFAKALGKMGQHHYGITGFDPLRPMDAKQLKAVLRRHAMRGARFVSFTFEPYGQGRRLSPRASDRAVDPGYPRPASAQLDRAFQQLLGENDGEPAR